MEDIDQNASVLRVPTGLRLTPELTFDDIFHHARARLSVLALGRAELAFLTEPGFMGRCRPGLTQDQLDVLAPLVFPQASNMAPSSGRGRQRDLLGMLKSDDEAREAAVKQVVARLQRNAELVEEVGEVMNTSADPQACLERIEQAEGVDLEPARRFHRGAPTVMVTEIEGRTISFRSLPVRTAVAHELPTACRLILGGARRIFNDYRAALEGDASDLFGVAFNKRRLLDVRIAMLRPWHRIVLEGARQICLPIAASAQPVISTATLKEQHLQVQDIQNWAELLDETIAVLQQARATLQGNDTA